MYCALYHRQVKRETQEREFEPELSVVSLLHCPPALWPVTSHSGPISYCPLMILALLRMKKVTKSIAFVHRKCTQAREHHLFS